jgi:hypothetical protein
MVRECPKCGLINPPTAEQCDCGYEFATGRVTGLRAPRRLPPPVGWLLVPVFVLIGIVLGPFVRVVLLDDPKPRGLAVVFYAFQGAVCGGISSAAAGIVVAVILSRRRRPE